VSKLAHRCARNPEPDSSQLHQQGHQAHRAGVPFPWDREAAEARPDGLLAIRAPCPSAASILAQRLASALSSSPANWSTSCRYSLCCFSRNLCLGCWNSLPIRSAWIHSASFNSVARASSSSRGRALSLAMSWAIVRDPWPYDLLPKGLHFRLLKDSRGNRGSLGMSAASSASAQYPAAGFCIARTYYLKLHVTARTPQSE